MKDLSVTGILGRLAEQAADVNIEVFCAGRGQHAFVREVGLFRLAPTEEARPRVLAECCKDAEQAAFYTRVEVQMHEVRYCQHPA